MNTIFKKVLGTFVEIEDAQDAAPAPTSSNSPLMSGIANITANGKYSPQSTPKPSTAPRTFTSHSSETLEQTVPTSSSDEAKLSQFEEHFHQLMRERNLPGPDFLELLQVMDVLPIDNFEVRLKTAFDTLKIQGVTKEILQSSARVYLDALAADNKSFSDSIKSQSETVVPSKQIEIANNEHRISSIDEQILLLQTERDSLIDLNAQLATEIQESTATIAKAAELYNAAYTKFHQHIQNMLININTLL